MIFKFSFIILIFIINLTGCGGSGSSGSIQEGITVSFGATPLSTTQKLPAGNKTFKTTEGVQITLKKAYLVIWSVKLETDCSSSNFVQWFDWLIPQAFAHAQATPSQLGVPNVIDILSDDRNILKLGEIYPPPATYCGSTVELMKADEDTQHLPKETPMLNKVLYIEGEYLPIGKSEAIPFVIDLAKTPRPRNLKFPISLVLSNTNRIAQLNFKINYDRWFDGIDFNALSQESQKDFLLNNVSNSFKN